MNNERAVVAFCIALILGISIVFFLERTIPAPADLSKKIDRLQKQLDDQTKEFSRLEAQETVKAKIGGEISSNVSPYLVDLEKKFDDQKTDDFAKSSFWATTYLTWFAFLVTFLIATVSVILAIKTFIDFRGEARKIAREEVDELNNILSGRLQLATSVILRKITWDTQYELRSETYNFSRDALKTGQRAMDYCEKITREDYDDLKFFALNNLLFYTTLNAPTPHIDEEYARNSLGLAARLRQVDKFDKDPDYVNTYSLAQLTFAKFLGDRSKISILEKLEAVRILLKHNFDGDRDLSPAQRKETSFLLDKVEKTQKIIEALPAS